MNSFVSGDGSGSDLGSASAILLCVLLFVWILIPSLYSSLLAWILNHLDDMTSLLQSLLCMCCVCPPWSAWSGASGTRGGPSRGRGTPTDDEEEGEEDESVLIPFPRSGVYMGTSRSDTGHEDEDRMASMMNISIQICKDGSVFLADEELLYSRLCQHGFACVEVSGFDQCMLEEVFLHISHSRYRTNQPSIRSSLHSSWWDSVQVLPSRTDRENEARRMSQSSQNSPDSSYDDDEIESEWLHEMSSRGLLSGSIETQCGNLRSYIIRRRGKHALFPLLAGHPTVESVVHIHDVFERIADAVFHVCTGYSLEMLQSRSSSPELSLSSLQFHVARPSESGFRSGPRYIEWDLSEPSCFLCVLLSPGSQLNIKSSSSNMILDRLSAPSQMSNMYILAGSQIHKNLKKSVQPRHFYLTLDMDPLQDTCACCFQYILPSHVSLPPRLESSPPSVSFNKLLESDLNPLRQRVSRNSRS